MKMNSIAPLVFCLILGAAVSPPAALAAQAANAGVPGMARPGAGMSDDALLGMVDRHMGRIFKFLQLTPEQRGRVETIRARHMDATEALRQSLATKRQDLFKLVRSTQASKESALAKQREISGLQAQLAEARIAVWFEARTVLTPEQLKRLEAMPLPGMHRRGRRSQGRAAE